MSIIYPSDARLQEIAKQEESKSTARRWMEFLFMFRESPRKNTGRYPERRFNPTTGKVE